LTAFAGTLIHDGWKPYRDLDCVHGLCNAHHLRELTYVFEEMGQAWAKRLIDLLLKAHREVAVAGRPLTAKRITYFRTAHARILAAGEAANPRAPPSGKRGRTRQSKALNLIDRLRVSCRRCLALHDQSQRPLSPTTSPSRRSACPRCKQKISGGFRTPGRSRYLLHHPLLSGHSP
jgi:transposase